MHVFSLMTTLHSLVQSLSIPTPHNLKLVMSGGTVTAGGRASSSLVDRWHHIATAAGLLGEGSSAAVGS